MQDLVLGLVEVYEVHTGPALKPVKVPLDGIPSSGLSTTTHFGVIGKLVAGALSPSVHVANRDVKQCGHNTEP